jgi:hypothetical protein
VPSAFRRIADELDPNYVPEWALRGRRAVPSYAKLLLSLFGPWWLPRLGLSLVMAAVVLEVAGIIIFAARLLLAGIAVLGIGILTSVAGSVLWSAYRMRHWLPGAPASDAPLAPPTPRSTWAWMLLAALAILGSIGLMMWLLASNGSLRAIVLGFGIFMICSGTAGAVLIRQADSVSNGNLTFAGMRARRLSLVVFAGSIISGATLLAQTPLLPPSR